METLIAAFHYGFMQRALLAGLAIAATCACIGPFLVLRRLSLIGDGLAHVCLATVAAAFMLGALPLTFSVPGVILAALVILKISERNGVYADAAIGIISSTCVAAAVVMASVGGGFNADLLSFLFGNILAVSRIETWVTLAVAALVCLVSAAMFPALMLTAMDEEYAQTRGVPVDAVNKGLIVLTALTVAVGVKAVGTMLVSGMLVIPSAVGLRIGRTFARVFVIALGVGVFSVFAGLACACLWNTPAGATIVLVQGSVFALVWVATAFSGRR
jgi:zinc transport system permease protein